MDLNSVNSAHPLLYLNPLTTIMQSVEMIRLVVDELHVKWQDSFESQLKMKNVFAGVNQKLECY